MDNEEDQKKAEKIALRMLTFRSRSKQEIRNKLTEKGISASVTEKVLDRLTGYGYLNDQSFAQQLAVRLLENKEWGFARIGDTLRVRGVAPELVNHIVSQLRKDYSEEETALRILKRRFSHINFHEASQKEKNRIIRFFKQRGFSWETIARVLML